MLRAGSAGAPAASQELGQVIILPVVRVERPEGPSDMDSGAGTPAGRKRRRRARS
jgi:hypothetical protein